MTLQDLHHVALGMVIVAGALVCFGVALLMFIFR